MPTEGTADETPEIHSIANLSPVSPAPVYNSTVSALPTLQSQADFFDSDPADQIRAIAMAQAAAESQASRTDVNVGAPEDDVSMDDDIYGDAEQNEAPQEANKPQEQSAAEADDEYAKTFDSPLSEEMGSSDEHGGDAQRDGPAAGTSDTGAGEHLNVSSVQSNTGAPGPVQPPPALDASTAAAADISTSSSVPSTSPAEIPPSHPSLPPKPGTDSANVEPSKGAHTSPSEPSQQMPDSALSPHTDGSNTSRPPAPLTGHPTHGQVNQNSSEQSTLPQPPSNPTPNGRPTLPPASADLPSRPPVDMNRIRADSAKSAARHGALNVKSLPKMGSQAPGTGPSFASAPGLPRAPAPGMTESMSALGPPPGPSNPSLPAPPSMPSNATSAPPIHYPARPVGSDGPRRGEQSKWEAYLADEKRYTAEQKWDRFPDGSRVFIGNLSSDKVTKRDVFDLFYRFGRLAQISLKSAFGFVQYHTVEEAQAAVDSLQGADVKGRKIHLEFSRTQKKKESNNERPRSPDRGVMRGRDAGHARGGRFEGHQSRRSRDDNRYGRHSGEFHPHHREDSYGRRGNAHGRPSRDRSFSPRSRGRDRLGKDSYRQRSRSPYGRGWAGDDARGPHSESREPAPDVQLLLLQEVDPGYVNWVRDAFTERGLRSDAMIVNPTHHIKQDVISRLVVAGVSGIVELDFRGQERGEVYLHHYDLSGGLSNVRFNEYRDLKPYQAADLVRGGLSGYGAAGHASAPAPAHAPAPAYPAHPAPSYPVGQPVLQPAAATYGNLTVQPPQQPAAQHHPADAANIQQILSQLQKSSAPAAAPAAAPQLNAAPAPVDIQALLGSLTGGSVGAPTPVQTPPQSYGYAAAPAAAQPMPAQSVASGGQGQGGAADAQVQNIMAQLARFRQ